MKWSFITKVSIFFPEVRNYGFLGHFSYHYAYTIYADTITKLPLASEYLTSTIYAGICGLIHRLGMVHKHSQIQVILTEQTFVSRVSMLFLRKFKFLIFKSLFIPPYVTPHGGGGGGSYILTLMIYWDGIRPEMCSTFTSLKFRR